MQFLKADTEVKVVIGPFVAVGDGFTPEIGITLSGADEAEVLKHENATTVSISGSTWTALTGVSGYYHLTLTSGNLDTEGMLTVVVQDASVCLPVRADYMVVAANVYDSLYAASGTDVLDVSVTQWLGTAAATPSTAGVPSVDVVRVGNTAQTAGDLAALVTTADAAIDVAVADLANATDGLSALKTLIDAAQTDLDTLTAGVTLAADAITAAKIADNAFSNEHFAAGALTSAEITSSAGAVVSSTGLDAVVVDSTFLTAVEDQVWDAVLNGSTHNTGSTAGQRLRQLDAAFVVLEGTGVAGSTSTTFNFDAGADGTTNDIYAGDRIMIIGGLGIGEHGIIGSYVASTKIATMTQAWVVTPDNTSEYIVVPADCDVESWQHVAVTNSTTTQLPEVDMKSISDDATAADNIELAGDNYSATRGLSGTALPAAAADGAGGLTISDTGGVDMDAIETAAAQIGTAGANLTDLGGMSTAMKAEVNAEVDTAIDTDTSTEPAQGAPGVNISLRKKIDWLYKAWRNKSLQNATTYELYNDDTTTVDHKATVSDDGTDAIKGEIVTGP